RYFQSENRFRDTAFSPDKQTMYVATDNGGLAESKSGGTTTTMQNPGSILVFTYKGDGATASTNEAKPAASVPTTTAATTASAAPAVASAGAPVTFTTAQSDRGKVAYNSNCVSCHGQNLISATYGTPLAGPYFAANWVGKPVGALYQHAHDRMPPSRPGSLPDETYADIIAYVLQVNGLPAGNTELPADLKQLDAMPIAKGGN
ncbi:MAG: cytochrome c, partial [Devosia sp.]